MEVQNASYGYSDSSFDGGLYSTIGGSEGDTTPSTPGTPVIHPGGAGGGGANGYPPPSNGYLPPSYASLNGSANRGGMNVSSSTNHGGMNMSSSSPAEGGMNAPSPIQKLKPGILRQTSTPTKENGYNARLSLDASQITTMSLGGEICTRCGQGFNVSEEIVKCNGESWHTRCFVDKKEMVQTLQANGQIKTDSLSKLRGAEAPSDEQNNNYHSETEAGRGQVVNGYHDNDLLCEKCKRPLDKATTFVNYSGLSWHPQCFVCAQCFQPFPDGIFYEFEGRKYCEHDFHVLFAPCCGKCREFIVGRVIKAMNANWHPDCFQCELCFGPLADAGFIKNAGRSLCRACNAREKALGMGKYVCHKCHSIIDEGHIKFRGEPYHPYHFNCTTCNIELNADAREKGGELYCLRCHDKMGIPICGACRRPIEERVVHALGKAWHVEHFVCAKCEKPFLGHRHYEKKGLAYCETHYHQLFGNICFVCNNVISGDVFSALNKSWCVDHFACSVCDKKMSQKTKFFEFDLKPVCKSCYDHFPGELKKRLKKAYEASPKK